MSLKTNLLTHQLNAFNKLKDIKVFGLLMDMGTGKTRTALEFIEYRIMAKKLEKVFWLCPVSTKSNLQDEIIKHSSYTSAFIENYTDEIICIIGIETISQSEQYKMKLIELLKKYPENMLIVDESHMIKNPSAVRTSFLNTHARNISKYRAILTGTPITQGIQDLYSQFYFLHPKILGYNSFGAFAKCHLEYSDKFPGKIEQTHNPEFITSKIGPYVYQITKDECLDLPPKTYSKRDYYLTSEDEFVYEQIKDYFMHCIEKCIEEENYIKLSYIIFRMLNYLHRFSSGYLDAHIRDYELKYLDIKHKSYERAEVVLSVLDGINLSKDKVIIWHRYQSDLELMQKVFDDNNLKYTFINGSVKESERTARLNKFRDTDTNVIIINQGIGSHGLNLQHANYMIYYNNTFDYSKRIQSEDRIYRIGQTKNCYAIDIVSDAGIDGKIRANLAAKKSLSKEIRENISKLQKGTNSKEQFKEAVLGGL